MEGSTGRSDSNHHKRQKSNSRTKGIPSESWENPGPVLGGVQLLGSFTNETDLHWPGAAGDQDQRRLLTKLPFQQIWKRPQSKACHGTHAGPGETFWDKHFRSYCGWDGRARRSGNKPEMSQEQQSLSLIGDGWVSTTQWYRRLPMQPFHFLLPVQLLDELWYIQT